MPALTGIRGVAALWVLFFHLPQTSTLPLFRNGYLGVHVFFILSGFIMSAVYSERICNVNAGEYLEFLQIRLARIYPLHAVSLFLVIYVAWALPGFSDLLPDSANRFTVNAAIRCAALIQNWGYQQPLACNAPSWSLSAEWAAYLVFPVICAMVRPVRSANLSLALAFVLLGGLITLLIYLGSPTPDVDGWPGMLQIGLEFPCGCLLYRAVKAGHRPMTIPFSILAVAFIAAPEISPGLSWLALFGFPLVILLAATDRGPIARVLTSRAAVFLGEVSFSLYMFHWIIIKLSVWFRSEFGIRNIFALTAISGVAVLCCLGVAVLSYLYLETPTRTWGRRLALHHSAIVRH